MTEHLPIKEIPLRSPVDGECGMDPWVIRLGAEHTLSQICYLPKDHPMPHRYKTRITTP